MRAPGEFESEADFDGCAHVGHIYFHPASRTAANDTQAAHKALRDFMRENTHMPIVLHRYGGEDAQRVAATFFFNDTHKVGCREDGSVPIRFFTFGRTASYHPLGPSTDTAVRTGYFKDGKQWAGVDIEEAHMAKIGFDKGVTKNANGADDIRRHLYGLIRSSIIK